MVDQAKVRLNTRREGQSGIALCWNEFTLSERVGIAGEAARIYAEGTHRRRRKAQPMKTRWAMPGA